MPRPDQRDESPQGEPDRSAADPGTSLTEPEYDQLRRIAAEYLRSERPGHTLQPTALVNEAILRLADADAARWNNRQHFVATAARAMRRILVDHARARKAEKRGGGKPGSLGIETVGSGVGSSAGKDENESVDLLALDEALSRLDALHERQARVVELRFFAGFSVAETAEHLGVSERTVELDWSVARAWLKQELRGGA